MKVLILLLALLGFGRADAQPPDDRLARLEAAYNRIQLEQQSVFQQFQMAQELRRNELQEAQPPAAISRYPQGTGGSQVLDYDENVRRQQARQERLLRYEQEISRAYRRYLELGDQKKALLDQIQALQPPQPAPRR